MFERTRDLNALKRFLDEDPTANGIIVHRLYDEEMDYKVYTEGRKVIAVKGKHVLFAGEWEGARVPMELLPKPPFMSSAAPWPVFEEMQDVFTMAWTAPCWYYIAPTPKKPKGGWEKLPPLTQNDAPEVARLWNLDSNPLRHIRECINKYPSACIRVEGKLAAWGGTHFLTDKAAELGFAHTKRKYRRQGFGRRITIDLTHRLYEMGYIPYCYVWKTNKASNAMVAEEGFKRLGDIAWFGVRARRKGARGK